MAAEDHQVFMHAYMWDELRLNGSEGETEGYISCKIISSSRPQIAIGISVKPLFTAILPTSMLILREPGRT